RVKWFSEKAHKHFKNVSDTPEEPRLGFVSDLCQAHNPADFIRGTKAKSDDADLRSFRTIHFSFEPEIFLRNAVEDFTDYCKEIQHTKKIKFSDAADSSHKTIWLNLTTSSNAAETYTLKIAPDSISLTSGSELGLARGLVELERRMAERGGPFLSQVNETNSPSFN